MTIASRIESLRERFQEKRADLFFELLEPFVGAKVLDLGGNRGDFGTRLLSRMTLDVTIADILDFSKECESRGLRFVQVSEQKPLPFDSMSFDVVFSNSVIEHVTLPKRECRSLEVSDEEWVYRASAAQRAFAKEVSRVGKGYFVQTPHPAFPIDLHMWLPLTNRLGHHNVVRATEWTEKYWIKKSWEADWHLIDPDSMRTLFPGSRIHVERLWGMPKSLIAYKPLS